MNIFEKVNITNFTESDFRILEFIKQQGIEITKMKLKEVSSQLFLSDVVVVRFCQKIGLSGFNELKYAIKYEKHIKEREELRLRQHVDRQIISLRSFLDDSEFESIKPVISLIESKSPLYIYGRSLSAIPARYLQTVLTTLNRRCTLIEDLHLLNGLSCTMDEGSILIIFSAKADINHYLEPLSNSKERGIVTVLVTANNPDCYSEIVDFIIVSHDSEQSYNGIDVNSRTKMMTITQMMIEEMSKNRKKSLDRNC